MIFKIVGRITIRFFRGLGRMTINTGRFTTRHPVGSFFIIAFLSAAITLLVSTNFLNIASADNSSSLFRNADGVTGTARESSVQTLKGLAAYNASQMWQGFNEDYRQTLARNGVDQARLQQLLDEAKKPSQDSGNAIVYEYFTWQGFGELRDGSGKADVFEATLKVGATETKTHYALKVDAKDRIRDIMSDDSQMSKTLFFTTVRSANPLVKPGEGSIHLLLGLSKSDAKEVWVALSDDYRQQLTESGVDQAIIQAAFDKLKSDTNASNYDHFTLRGNQTDTTSTSTIEQYAAYMKNSATPQFTYTIGLDMSGRVAQITSNDPLMQAIFLESLVRSSDATLKPRSAGVQVLQGISKFNAKLIWNGLSNAYKKALTADGFTQTSMQTAIDSAVKELDIIGEKPQYTRFELAQTGQTRDTGSNAEMYNVSYKVNGRETSTVFVVKYDSNDMVAEIVSQDPIVSAALRRPSNSATLPQTGSELLSPSFVAERLMSGLTSFDSKKIWASFSASYQKALSVKGISPTTMAAEMNNYKTDAASQNIKLSYVGYSFVSGKSYPAGNAEAKYSATLQYDDRADQYDYLIILDGSGKIQAITTSDPILSAMLGRIQSNGMQNTIP
ncbi:hypothetical protein [Candidatus Chlorohelix sp.]|uniref:hypothetical protein n=1 Tax=Candidatus Chlorohelix sp. TaxID=3139201 RepID=UPI003074293B